MKALVSVYEVIKDLVYEDAWQFLGPIVAVLLLAIVGAASHGIVIGLALFVLVAASLAMSLRRER